VARILRAFLWLRWRTLLNSLERRGSRDVLERFSIAFEQLAPTIAAIIMLPSIVMLAGLSAYAGWSLAQGARSIAFEVVRFLLFAACLLSIAGPVMLPGGDRTNAVRLLLLPIPRGVLYLAHAIGAFADPWVVLAAAVLAGLPLGLAAGGQIGAALLAAGVGLALLATLVGITLAVASAVHLIVRDRRRGELMALAIVVILPMLGLLPALLQGGRHAGVDTPREPRRTAAVERALFATVPSELYVRAVRSASAQAPQMSATPAGALLVVSAAIHGVAFIAFVRLLSSPGTSGRARGGGTAEGRRWRIPGLSPGVSAVAINQLRLAFRTPRGRATLLSPIVVFGMFTAMALRGRGDTSFGPFDMRNGLGMAAFSTFVSLMALLPLAMNQFAIDRAGLTMTMLAPIETVALLRGKAVGNAGIALIPGIICFIGAVTLFPGGDPALWACVPLSAIAAYVLVAPVAAMLSAFFPKAVDLNSIGSGSNAHGAAGLIGMLSFVAAAAPGGLIAVLISKVLDRPALAPLGVLVWILISLAISAALFRVAAAVFDRRRENLGLTAQRS
jgi:hypothetical protein